MKRKKPNKASASPSFASPELGQIEELLRFMSQHNLEEFEYSRGDLRIRLRKPASNTGLSTQPRPPAEIIVPSAMEASPTQSAAAASEAETELRGGEDLYLVKSPIVGTFYASPSPGA